MMKPRNLFYALLGLLGLVALIVFGSFWYANGLLNQKITKLNKLSTDLVLENEQLNRLSKLEAQYKEIQPLAAKASSVLPAQKEQDQVVAQVATIVQKNGLELAGLTFEKTTGLPDERSQTQASSIGGILIMPVKFQTTGSYKELQNMLTSFEKQQRYMRVSTLDLTRDPEGNVTAGIVLEVFLRP